MDSKAWWEVIDFCPLGQDYNSEIESWCGQALQIKALRDGGTVYQKSAKGAPLLKSEELVSKITDLGGRLVFVNDDRMMGNIAIYCWDNAYLKLNTSNSTLYISFATNDLQLFQSIETLTKSALGKKVSSGRAFVLIQTQEGIRLSSIGTAAIPFEPLNYNEPVVAAYQHVVQDLQTISPCGRLTILDGAPGTGKSFLIRALLSDVPNALFIIVPSQMVSELSGPTLVPTILETKEDLDTSTEDVTPIVFIIEDADACLAPRAADNMQSISSLLNFSDGIMGAMMDIRLICTTNATVTEMDDAIMRPGRLCRRIEVDGLNHEQAKAIYHRLTGQHDLELDKKIRYTLAEVYKMARDDGWQLEKPHKTAGFMISNENSKTTTSTKDAMPPSEKERVLKTIDDVFKKAGFGKKKEPK